MSAQVAKEKCKDLEGFARGTVVDVTGDGGVLVELAESDKTGPNRGALPNNVDGCHATIKYRGMLENGAVVVDSSGGHGSGDALSFSIGSGDVISGIDTATRYLSSLHQGGNTRSQHATTGATSIASGDTFDRNIRATVTLRHDYAYGDNGLPGRVPPCAKLIVDLQLLSVSQPSTTIDAEKGAKSSALPALPPAEAPEVRCDGQTPPGGSANRDQTLLVGGQPLKLDALGPIVLNSDGTTSRISNWSAMTEAEQRNTIRLIAKRNKKRQAELTAAASAAAPSPES